MSPLHDVVSVSSRETTIAGVRILPLPDRIDERGDLFELFRDGWLGELRAAQWNVVRSRAGVLRGVHWHEARDDLICTISGRLTLGLIDLRVGSPTARAAELLVLDATRPELVVIATGVGHGLLSIEPTVVLYGMSETYDGDDEFGVSSLDPALGLDWPVPVPVLSGRDRTAPPLAEIQGLPVWTEDAACER